MGRGSFRTRAAQWSGEWRAAVRPVRGMAAIEALMVVPVLFLLLYGVVGFARLTRTRMSVAEVARETARVAALANTPGEASSLGEARGREVAAGYGLDGPLELSVSPGALRPGARVTARASYVATFGDLPLLGWTPITLTYTQSERVDPHRSRPPGGRR